MADEQHAGARLVGGRMVVVGMWVQSGCSLTGRRRRQQVSAGTAHGQGAGHELVDEAQERVRAGV
jgi:hypothetical protein